MNLKNLSDNSYALLGSGIGYSISPTVHGEIFACRGMDGKYFILDVPESDLGKIVEILRQKNICFNVTIPFKEKIIEYLDYVDPMCKSMGSVNTVKCENGRLCGYSTDGDGFRQSFTLRGIDFEGKKAIVLGSGGAARAICYNLLSGGAMVSVISRNSVTADNLAVSLTKIFGEGKITIGDDYEKCDVLVNTTPVGTMPALGFATQDFRGAMYYFDAVYNPINTKSVILARQQGICAFGGLDMLIGQAVKAQEIWNGTEISREEFLRIRSRCESVINSKYPKKILLAGFMGVGKSTVGRLLAEKTDLNFYDLDSVIENTEGQSINDIFAQKGEAGFRQSEYDCLKRILECDRAVIALGGGALLQGKNRELIDNSGCFMFNLSCSIETLEKRLENDKVRPLLKTRKLADLLVQRKDEYIKYSDFTVCADDDPESVADLIYRLLYKC